MIRIWKKIDLSNAEDAKSLSLLNIKKLPIRGSLASTRAVIARFWRGVCTGI